MIESIVIVTSSRGHTAHLRFADKSRDCDIADTSKYTLYSKIEAKLHHRKKV